VTGCVITLLGISLLGVGMNWAAGGDPGNPGYGAPRTLSIALFVFLVIVAVTKYGRGIWHSLAILIGMTAGTLVSIPLGIVHAPELRQAAWIAAVLPFRFGAPTFHLGAMATLCVVMIVTLVESTGVFLALAEITGKRYGPANLVQALRADGVGIATGAIFSAFAYTSYSQNVGLVSITKVRSRFFCAMGGAILILLGLLPKLAHIVAAVPQPVLGGAGLVMFGMVAATGIRILSAVDFIGRPHDLFITASALGIGLIPTLAPRFFAHMPDWSAPVTGSSVVLGTLVAVLLNFLLNGFHKTK
jgi:uric acid transporter